MDSKQQFWISLLSGGCAGTATDIAFFPIDTIKTRLQAKGGFFANGGYHGIYRGLGSLVVLSAPSLSLFFITYDFNKVFLKEKLSPYIKNESTLLNVTHMLSASLGEVVLCSVRVPAEVVKQRTQTLHFKSSLQSFKYILQQNNVWSHLYRGWDSTVIREIPFTMIQYPLYEFLKSKWNHEKTTPLQGSICGFIAGGFAAAVTTPLDVLKTRIMLHHEKVGVVKLAKMLYKEEGGRVFWNGVVPRTLWISAGGAIFLGVYEFVSDSLRSTRSKIE